MFAIPLGRGPNGEKLGYGVCRQLGELEVEFYDFRSNVLPTPEDVRRAHILFTTWVSNLPFKSGAWTKIGHLSLSGQLPVIFCKQDAETGALSLIEGGHARPATFEECEGREPAAMWNSAQIEARLTDHFCGRPNKRLEALKPKPFPNAPATANTPPGY